MIPSKRFYLGFTSIKTSLVAYWIQLKNINHYLLEFPRIFGQVLSTKDILLFFFKKEMKERLLFVLKKFTNFCNFRRKRDKSLSLFLSLPPLSLPPFSLSVWERVKKREREREKTDIKKWHKDKSHCVCVLGRENSYLGSYLVLSTWICTARFKEYNKFRRLLNWIKFTY